MGQYDTALRYVVHRHGKDLAQALLPRFPVESVAWAETQLLARERRLDRALELRGQGRRQQLQIELAVRARRRLAYRMFEYAAQLVLAALDPWGHNLREEIKMQMRELDRNAIMKSATLREVFEEGIEKGIEKGRHQLLEEMLRSLLGRHLQRELTPDEQAAVAARASTLSAEQAAEVVQRLDGDALQAWLLDRDAE